MKIDNERTEVFHKFYLDITDSESETLARIGLERIKNDREALINYAVNVVLRDKVDELEKEEGVEDGKSNSWR